MGRARRSLPTSDEHRQSSNQASFVGGALILSLFSVSGPREVELETS